MSLADPLREHWSLCLNCPVLTLFPAGPDLDGAAGTPGLDNYVVVVAPCTPYCAGCHNHTWGDTYEVRGDGTGVTGETGVTVKVLAAGF